MRQTDSIQKTAASLFAGKPVVFPTDTVYGIGVAVGLSESPKSLFDIKRRDAEKAIPWLVGSKNALQFYDATSELRIGFGR
ncbi:MAG: L-threonylcarbamoyladenylate synthase [Slackia sp.]